MSRAKKEIQKSKKSKSENVLLLQEKEEILKLKIISAKKNETDLQNELSKYEIDVALHQRELKRMKDEESSRFNNFPLLNNGRSFKFRHIL